MTSIKEALKELPSHDKNNFAKIQVDGIIQKTSSKRLPVYVPTKDHKSNLIITEKSHVLLKFLHKNWETKKESNKRENKNETAQQTPKKKIKIDRVVID